MPKAVRLLRRSDPAYDDLPEQRWTTSRETYLRRRARRPQGLDRILRTSLAR